MKENITINLCSFGFKDYYLTESGRLYKAAPTIQEIKKDNKNRFLLTDTTGNKRRISLKKIYRFVFKKEFCYDKIGDLIGEEWKPIENTNGKYFISNCGRVKSYCGYSAKILKPYKQNCGYLEVKINNKNYKIHQLVALHFCENKYKGTTTKIEIHHKNKVRFDNRSINLQILSVAEHHKEHNKKESADNE